MQFKFKTNLVTQWWLLNLPDLWPANGMPPVYLQQLVILSEITWVVAHTLGLIQVYREYLEGNGWKFPNSTPRAATEAPADCRMFSASYCLLSIPRKVARSKSASPKYEATAHASSMASSLRKSRTARKLCGRVRNQQQSYDRKQQHQYATILLSVSHVYACVHALCIHVWERVIVITFRKSQFIGKKGHHFHVESRQQA